MKIRRRKKKVKDKMKGSWDKERLGVVRSRGKRKEKKRKTRAAGSNQSKRPKRVQNATERKSEKERIRKSVITRPSRTTCRSPSSP